MPNLEPTYLRYVYDSLSKGSLNAENAAALPRGFIGLYEQEFTQKTPAGERKKVLHQLALWALFKGPVSANMAAAVLELEEEQMKDLVDTYSSWFNSPESGKYQLYHERLRVYLLQKLKAEEVQVLNEKLISFLESAIKQAKGEEDEYYALEHLHQHMALESQLGNHYDRLHSYVNQDSLWRRQIQLSKGYAWSQNAVQKGIKEGARRNHEMNTIRSTVNSVKLMTQEQNSAEDMLNLLNEGDYLTALKRAESWEGERQFKLYLLFIHELTIGTSSEADFRKEACKAVLEAIYQTQEDHSVLDWCKFYPELAIYKYHEELLKMELDGMVIWKRGDYTLDDIIESKDVNISIIKNLASQIIDAESKSKAYFNLSNLLMEQGDKKESLRVASEIIDEFYKSEAYANLSNLLMEQGDKKESLRVASEIIDDFYKSEAYANLSNLLLEQGDEKESLRVASEIINAKSKAKAYLNLSNLLMEQGDKKESLRVSSEIIDDFYKSKAYLNLYNLLMEQGDEKGAKSVLKESHSIATEIIDAKSKSKAYLNLSNLLMKQGDKKESLRVASEIIDDFYKSKAYLNLYNLLMEQGDEKGAKSVLKESYSIISEIKDDEYKRWLYTDLTKILLSKNQINEAILLAAKIRNFLSDDYYYRVGESMLDENYVEMSQSLIMIGELNYSFKVVAKISNVYKQSIAYTNLFRVLIEQGDKEGAKSALKESLKVASKIKDNQAWKSVKNKAYLNLYKLLLEQGDENGVKSVLKESLRVASKIKDDFDKSETYANLSRVLMERGDKEKSFSLVSEIRDDHAYIVYAEIYRILFKQGKNEEMKLALKKSVQLISEKIGNDGPLGHAEEQKCNAYISVCKIILKQNQNKDIQNIINNAFMLLNFMITEYENKKQNVNLNLGLNIISAATKLSCFLNSQGTKKKASQILNKSAQIAKELKYFSSPSILSNLYSDITIAFIHQRKKNESLRFVLEITDDSIKSITYSKLYRVLMEQGKMKESKEAMKESLKVASEIANDYSKSRAYAEISTVLMEQGKMKDAIQIAKKIKKGSDRLGIFNRFGKTLIFKEAQNILKTILSEDNQSAVIKGMSKKIKEQMELSEAVNLYLYNFSEYTQHLSNILFYQTKMACFFDEEHNEEKLDMLSEVLEIKDWRKISASA